MSENNEIINGAIKISDEVVETIASVAISEIKGVSSTGVGLVDGIAKRFTKKPTTSGIKANISEDVVTVDINIVVKYGERIPEVAWDVQDSVKKEIELMTGLTVDKVNVRVVGIDFPVSEEPEDVNKDKSTSEE